jgi:hypothetical protein
VCHSVSLWVIWGTKKHLARTPETVFSYFEARFVARLQVELQDDEVAFRRRWSDGVVKIVDGGKVVLNVGRIEE